MKRHLLSVTLAALGLCAAFVTTLPAPSERLGVNSSSAVLFAEGDSSAEMAVGAGAAVQVDAARIAVVLPSGWKLRSKSQLKVRTPTQVRCTRSGWKRAKAPRRSVYVGVDLTCTAPADGAKRTVVLYKAKRKSQQLTVEITSPAPSTPSPPAPAPGTPEPPPEPAPVRDQGLADDYAYLDTQKDNPALPITWDKCTPIDVAVNMSSGPAEELDLVVAAINSVAATSGLPLRYAGPTSYMPTLPSPGPYPDGIDIVFAFASTRESSYLNGAMAGYGGLIFTGADFHWAVRGRAVIDWSVTSNLSGGLEGQRAGVYMHELGHAVGMGHAAGNVQLMYGTIGPSNTPGWGAGDRTGLATLGAQPCKAL